MSDMVGVAGPVSGSMGNARVQNGGARVSQDPAAPAPLNPPSGMRTPTDIMRQRRDREARRKAEQEARDKGAEQVGQQHGLEQPTRARAPQYAGGASDPAAQRGARAQRPSRGPEVPPSASAGSAPTFRATGTPQAAGRPDFPVPPETPDQSSRQKLPSQQNLASGPGHYRSQSATAAGNSGQAGAFPRPPQGAPSANQPDLSNPQQPRRAGFPHAFERWETLSSHWEGLTSYWIRKLEENSDNLDQDPLSQQLARQITDLSAAGANLFHAVVELQRLRASSERKFQRWFFDTRSEQERAKEVHAELERQLKIERQGRADAFAAAQAHQQDKVRAEELLREMRRELQISKEEARRAWEELGRREQEERDRTNSLRSGEPTLVGGVQVVPMILPSRHPTRPPTREGPYPGGPTATTMGTECTSKPAAPDAPAMNTYYGEGEPTSPTGSDPFLEHQKIDPATSKPPYPTYEPGLVPPTSEPDLLSYVGSSEADEDYQRDQQTYPPPLSEGSEYDQSPVDERTYVSDGAYTSSSGSAPIQAPYPPQSADYTGSGWGVGTGWESVTPRHRHPTRLSDVLEEDEPSRTSPSRASRASQVSRSIF